MSKMENPSAKQPAQSIRKESIEDFWENMCVCVCANTSPMPMQILLIIWDTETQLQHISFQQSNDQDI